MANMDSFKPELFWQNLVLAARKMLPGLEFCNTQITQGLREKGDQLNINTLGDPSASNTDESTPMTYSNLDTTNTALTLTLDKTVAVRLNDKNKLQVEASAVTLEAAIAGRMVYTLADEVDQLIMGKYTEATVDNYETGTTPWQWGATPTAAEIAKFFASVHKSMDDANCEDEGRFISLPNIAIQGIRIAMGTIETNQGDSVRARGLVYTNMHGFRVYRASNAVSASSVTHGIAGNLPNVGEGVPGCIACGIQIDPSQIEKLRLEGYWADGIRARVLAGAKVFKADRTVDVNLNDSLLA
jgi:hypothetical protein